MTSYCLDYAPMLWLFEEMVLDCLKECFGHCKVQYVDCLETYSVSSVSFGVQQQLDTTTAGENGGK